MYSTLWGLGMRAATDLLAKLLSLIVINQSTECWNWQGTKTSDGYGRIGVSGRLHLAHRVMFSLQRKAIPKGMLVLHKCDNPACINPGHLFLGTQQDNMTDCKNKGRIAKGDKSGARLHPEKVPRGDRHYFHLHPEKSVRGEQNGRSKLTNVIVLQARKLYRDGVTIKCLAAKYGVSPAVMSKAIHKKTWKHV